MRGGHEKGGPTRIETGLTTDFQKIAERDLVRQTLLATALEPTEF